MRQYRLTPRFFVLLIAVTLIVFSVSTVVAVGRLNAECKALASFEEEYDAAALKCAELETEISYVQTDEYVERAARDQLGWIYANEYRYTYQR